MSFPALKPTELTLTLGEYGIRQGDWLGVWESPELTGSAEADIRLALRYDNIPNADGIALLQNYRRTGSGFFPITLPSAVLSAIASPDMRAFVQNPPGLVWTWESEPSYQAVKAGVVSVSIPLIAELRTGTLPSPPEPEPGAWPEEFDLPPGEPGWLRVTGVFRRVVDTEAIVSGQFFSPSPDQSTEFPFSVQAFGATGYRIIGPGWNITHTGNSTFRVRTASIVFKLPGNQTASLWSLGLSGADGTNAIGSETGFFEITEVSLNGIPLLPPPLP